MKTDITRSTFDPAKRYSSVRQQQGKVQLDADWNEEIDILARREALSLIDIVGPAGAPEGADGFHIVAAAAGLSAEEAARPGNQPVPAVAAGNYLITAGRAYVQGLQIENPAITTLATQPDLPGAGPLTASGVYLAYLDVWERPITSLEDPAIREVALGGPDTATRTHRVWQVRTVRVGDSGTPATCGDSFAAYDAAIAPSTGRLAARAEPDPAADGPCVLPEDAGYRSLENQLYRVECRVAGTRATARFVWSRENGSVATAWLGQNGPELTVSSAGPDLAHGFANGDWVELIDEGRELRGEAGTLVRVLTVRGNVLTIDPATATGTTTFAQFPSQPRIRRWDGDGVFAASGDNWVPLEQGVQVRFAAGSYRVGDYWMIPARTNTANVDWPREGGGAPRLLPPMGIAHAYGRLALIDFDGTATLSVTDCRSLFPPLTGLTQLDYVGGDGQEAMPDLTQPAAGVDLAEPLQVAVSRGATPVPGARVRFSVTSGGGRVNGAASVEIATGADGIASVAWRLGTVGQPQRVEARLLAPGGTPRHVPVRFSANFSTADEVAFDPANCPPLAAARNLQQAIEILCQQGGGVEPGFRIERIVWLSDGSEYQHDGTVEFDLLSKGLMLVCDDVVDPLSVLNRPVVFVTVLGRPATVSVSIDVARMLYRLEATLEVNNNEILWIPGGIQGFLTEGLERPLFELTVRGDNIRAAQPAENGMPRWLDADGLEFPGQKILPTGDTRRGGTLVSWFWMGERAGPGIRFVDVVRPGPSLITGRLVNAETTQGMPGVPVTLTSAGLDTRTATTNPQGAFQFTNTPAALATLSAESGGSRAQNTVPPLILVAQPFRPTDFRVRNVAEVTGVSRAMATRLARAGLGTPELVANLDAAELARRLDVTEANATTLLDAVRGAAQRRV
jgi:hypothetical protein